MPIKAVKPHVAEAINNLTALLKQEYGCDFAYTVMGNGFVLAQHNINGVQQPIPLVEQSKTKPKEVIQRSNMTTKGGNILQFFYNPENSLVVVDIIHKNEKGGNELLRQTLDEKKLLSHAK